MDLGHLLGATAGMCGYGYIDKKTDLAFVFDFTCK